MEEVEATIPVSFAYISHDGRSFFFFRGTNVSAKSFWPLYSCICIAW
jgi:hypothetical protein